MATTLEIDFNTPVSGRICMRTDDALVRLLVVQGIAKIDHRNRVLNVTREVENYSVDLFRCCGLNKAADLLGFSDVTAEHIEFHRHPPKHPSERHVGQLLEYFGVELKYVDPGNLNR